MKMNLKIRNSMDFKVSLGGFGGSKGGGSNEAKSAIGLETLAGVHVLGSENSVGNLAGQFILGDFSAVNIEIEQPNIVIADWEQGSIGSSGNFDSAANVRTPDYISLPTGTKSIFFDGISNVSGKTLQFDILTYNESNKQLQDLYWYDSGVFLSIADNAAKFKAVLKFSDGSNMTPSNIGEIRMFYIAEG